MRFATVFALLAVFSTTFAQPLESRDPQPLNNPNNFSPEEKKYYTAVGQGVAKAKAASSFPNPPSCDLTAASMPVAPSPLPPPGPGMKLAAVVVGRGTQNYSCETNTAASTPVQYGAVASLFNVSCIAGPYPELLMFMPNVSVKYPVPAATNALAPANVLFSGHHYFLDNTTPFFDLGPLGNAALKKDSATPAPDASRSVPWLKLVAKTPATGAWGEVYRVNTAGGQPPKTCEGQANKFEVQYATEYWLWAPSK